MSTVHGCSDRVDRTTDEELDESMANEVFKRIVTSIPKINQTGRRKICDLPRNHIGPVPNVPVGTSWKYRLQVSECGVHRPIVAGIHGRENEGAFSIVLSGVYEDDKDFGEYFLYSGCGGKEKDKTKRLGTQVFDQELKRHNKALALCCNAPIDDLQGADAKSTWKLGKPVRVVRKCSLGKYSEFAPKEGYRYDGIYKVARYYPVINSRTGLRVWTYELRRDDASPAPWSDEGIRNIERLNLKMILPQDDYLFSKVEKETDKVVNKSDTGTYICSTIKNNKIILKRRNVMPKKYPKKMKRNDEDHRGRRMKAVNERGYDLRLRPPTVGAEAATAFDVDIKPDTVEAEAATTFDVDIKPDISSIAYASGADIPYATSLSEPISNLCIDVKPNISDLNRQANEFSVPLIDIEEDIKPDIRLLEAAVAKQHYSIGNDTAKSSFHESDFPVIRSTCSLIANESLTLPSHIASPCQNQSVDGRANVSHDFKISNVSSCAFNSEPSYKISSTLPPHTIFTCEDLSVDDRTNVDCDFKISNVSTSASMYDANYECKIPSGLLESNLISPSKKKQNWAIPFELLQLIAEDFQNKSVWDYLKTTDCRTMQDFLNRVKIMFSCPSCSNLVNEAITTPCQHIVCSSCLAENFEKRIFTCPYCRSILAPDIRLGDTNVNLDRILNFLFSEESSQFLPAQFT